MIPIGSIIEGSGIPRPILRGLRNYVRNKLGHHLRDDKKYIATHYLKRTLQNLKNNEKAQKLVGDRLRSEGYSTD
jgi:hypothetical protein